MYPNMFLSSDSSERAENDTEYKNRKAHKSKPKVSNTFTQQSLYISFVAE